MKKNYFNPEAVGKIIKRLRKEKAISQFDFSDMLFISERQLRRYENDGLSDINIIFDIANYLKIDPLDIIREASYTYSEEE